MKASTFFSSVEESRILLNKFELLKNSNLSKKISTEFIGISRQKDFIATYDNAIKLNNYHLLLFDDSFIQFELIEPDKKIQLRYSYYQYPYDFMTYEEYLASNKLTFYNVGYERMDEFDQLLSEAPKKESFLSIRYDYSEDLYNPGVHSVSHFHIGYGESMRITSSICITPILFVMFILKNIYYSKWKMIIKDADFLKKYNKVKDKCDKIEKCFFNDLDKKELYLT